MKTYALTILLTTAAAICLVVFPISADEPRHGGELVITYGGGAPPHFNPALASGSSVTIPGAQLFASPLRYDEHWNPQPYLARSWEMAEDGLSLTLHLVEHAVFHDGEPISSKDVAFSVMTVKEYHPFQTMFAPVERVDTPDPHTAVLQLSRPHPAILLAMSPALLPILPQHVYGDGQDVHTHPANLRPVGSGPFVFEEYRPGESLVLRRNEDFFLPERPYLERLMFRFESEPMQQIVEIERQDAHIMPVFVAIEYLDRLSEHPHLFVTNRSYEAIGPINWLAFNLLREPFQDIRVRQAVAYAVDPDFIIAHLHKGYSRRATGPISPDSPFYDPSLRRYDLDLDKANALLDDAGYHAQTDGMRFTATLDYLPAVPSQQREVALYLKRQLSRIGIDLQLRRSADFSEWARRIGNWDFDMTLDVVYNWGDPVIGVHRSYLSSNIRRGVLWSNTQNYSNPRVDELLTLAERELNVDRRNALYREFQQILSEELPVIWINLVPYHTISHAGLGNPPSSIWGVHSPLDEVYWREAPQKDFMSPLRNAEESPVERLAKDAIELLGTSNFYQARDTLSDPQQGFPDLDSSGRHVIGVTREGIVFLDNSGQMTPGISISGLLDLAGNDLLDRFRQAADGRDDGLLSFDGVWPHPGTHRMGKVSAWCGPLSENDIVCGLRWE